MKTHSLWIPLAAVALGGTIALTGCGGARSGGGAAGTATVSGAKDTATVSRTFEVTGMMCTGCEAAIKAAVKKLPGVTMVDADYEKGEATVVYDPKAVSEGEITGAIERAGYTVAGEAPVPAGSGSDTKTERP